MTLREARPTRAGLLLVVIVGVALALRLWGLSFGLPHVLARPDELFVFGVAFRMLEGDPNPRMFDYPGVYLYFVAGLFAIYYWWSRLTGRVSSAGEFRELFRVDYEPFFLMARALTAVAGALTVAVCHLIAAPLFGRLAGLLSAGFLAVAFLHVRDSHYATTDVPLTLFVMCAILAVLRVHRTRAARDAWLAGAAAGLATGIKYNAAAVVVPLAVVELLHAWTIRRDWRRMLRETHLWRMALAAAAVFLVTNPYLVLDYGNAVRQLQSLAGQASAGMTPPEMLGNGWVYHLPFSLRYGLGLPLLAASLVGLGWMAVRRPAAAVILGSFPVAYYVAAGAGYNVFVRYMVPVVPFLCIFAAYLVAEVSTALARRFRLPRAALAGLLAVAIATPSAWSVVQHNRLLSETDSRVLAAAWVAEHMPAGRSVYMSGNRYGHPQIEGLPGDYRIFGYDWRASTFTHQHRHTGEYREDHVGDYPDVIIVQRSAIPYSHIPEQVERLLPDLYRLVHQIRAADLSVRNPYDIQDAFYLAYGRYEGVRRPGPNIEIHVRRDR
jgi:4-amino-4-deoxy-L-arabinose transferase-like glycosyltransferase